MNSIVTEGLIEPLVQAQTLDSISSRNTPWLKEISEDGTIWTIKGGSNSKAKDRVLDFNYLLPDGSKLTDEKNAHFLQMARAYAWVFRLYSPQCDAAIQIERVNSLLTFFYWLRMQNVNMLSSVTQDHIDIFAEKVSFGREWAREAPLRLYNYIHKTIAAQELLPRKNSHPSELSRLLIYREAGVSYFESAISPQLTVCAGILDWLQANGKEACNLPSFESILSLTGIEPSAMTVQSIHRALLPIEELWEFRHQLPTNNLKIQPFRRGASERASQLGVSTNRHPTIPPRLGMSYLSGALIWLLDYAEIIIEEVIESENVSVRRLGRRLQEAGLEIEVHTRPHSPSLERKVNVMRLVEILSAACFAIIAALSARRVDEIADLGSGCVLKDDNGHYWLKVYIEKTSQRYDQIPIPVAVQKAIACMERISKPAREESGDDSVWQLKTGGLRQLKPSKHLDRLSFYNNLITGEGKNWHFTAHQFRRFFAILYFWRYENGDLPALSHHLRHFDLEMTKRYVTDSEMGHVWKEVEAEWQADFIRGVIDGSRKVGGKAGMRMKREADKLMSIFRKSIDVVPPERVIQALQRLAKRLGSEFKQHVWGTICACPKNTKFSEHARCKGPEKTGPVFKYASEDLCAACPFAIHTDRFVGAVDEDLGSRRATALCSDSDTILSQLSKVQIVSLESFLKNGETIPELPGEGA